MYNIEYSGQFKKDVKLAKKRSKDLEKLKKILDILASGEEVPAEYKEHPLIGNWKGYRDIHIEPDWLLIYIKTKDTLRLERTGSHVDLF